MRPSMKRLGVLAFALCQPVIALAEEAAEHGAEHGGHGGWDSQALIASFVNFAVLIGLFVYLFRDKVRSSLKDRRDSVERALQEAARMKAEAEVKRKEYTERLAKLDQELAEIKSEMIAAGQAERDRIIADAEHKAARMRKEAEFIIEQQVKQLRTDIAREAANAAIASAEQLLLRATTTYDQQRLAQEYLTALSDNKSGVAAPKRASTPIQPESRV